MNPGGAINWPALQRAHVQALPFPHLVIAEFIHPSRIDAISRDFPVIQSAGSFPLQTLSCGDACREFMQELQQQELALWFQEQFAVPLIKRPTMITLRGNCRASDGKIHRDSKAKIVTVLIYLNNSWRSEGGHLRLLNGPDDIEDYFTETPPDRGTMIAFVCTDNAWHGHKRFVGPRRAIQLNWVRNERYLRLERYRHQLSAGFKKLFGSLV